MKRKPDNLKRLLIFNVLLLALFVLITINLIETGGQPLAAIEQPAATQPAS
jgi:hypothetical protein